MRLTRGTTITITDKTAGTAGNTVTVSSSSQSTQTQWTFSPPSFSGGGATLGGGVEPEGPSLDHNFFVTQYSYDALGNLLQVTQKGDPTVTTPSQWRVRNFTYDSLGRLLAATNPESGTLSYVYDANGNVLQKTSPAPNAPQGSTSTQTISYCYDALNRVTGKAYSAQTCTNGQLPAGTAAVSYAYDTGANGIGHLTSLTDQAGSASYTFDVLGRMAGEARTINSVSKNLSYSYNLDGSLKTLTYPSGAVVTYTPDAAGRTVSGVDNGNGINYAARATYDATGALTGFISGNSASFAGITNSYSFNKRLQPVFMSAASPTQTVYSIGYDFHFGAGDNGNVYALANNKDHTRDQTFAYDALNRLTSAQNAGTDCTKTLPGGGTAYWGNSYGYDAWDNLLAKTVTKCSAESMSYTASANNQLQGLGYDAAGNMTKDNLGHSYTYDQENRITGAAGFTYTYDSDGNRVEKSNGSTGTLYWYMTPGIVAESDLAGTLQSEYVFFDGERVARKDFPSNAVSYYFSDHLKTTDIVTDALGNIKNESDYYPWGGDLQFLANDSNHYKFTGKERDSETQLDYFGARYYSNGLGRFITPDWAAKATAVPYADFGNPQSLNLYAYTKNNPTTFRDADGHCGEDACVIEGGTALVVIGIGVVAGAEAYFSTPSGQRSLRTFTAAAGQSISHSVDTIKGWFHKPGTTSTNVKTGTPGTTSTDVKTGTPTQAVDQATKDKIKDNAGGKCEYCGKTTTTTADTASGRAPAADEGQTDHYKPKSKGGTDDESNLAHSCRACNGPGGKGNADPTDPNDAAGQRWRLPRMEKQQPQ